MRTSSSSVFVYICLIIINTALNQPHGIVQISNVNPRDPKILIDEQISSTIPIAIERVGGCKYAAEIGFKCLERTAKDGLDFKCHYERLKWKDGECDQKIVYITVYNDNEYEENEEFLFQLYSLPNNIALGFDRALIVIQQNDANYGEIGIYPAFVSVVEGMSFVMKIKRMFGKINQARVCYQIVSGTAKINFDVTFIEDCVEWKHNDDKTHFVTVDTISDDLWEGNETFSIELLNAEGARLSHQHSQATVTILQNNLNVQLISSTFAPCVESKKEIRITPGKQDQVFVQFEVGLPQLCTVNDAHIIAEHITASATSLKSIVLKVQGIVMDESTVSCDNIPTSYDIISHQDIVKPQLNCVSIINDTTIVDNNVNYACDYTVECINFDSSKNQPKYITVNTIFQRPQRLICGDLIEGSNNISCECDFPTIYEFYESDEWLLSNVSFGSKYLSYSLAFNIREMTQHPLWNNHSLATFLFTIKEYDIGSNINTDGTTDWILHLVTDAFPCQEIPWSEWSACDAIPVGIGHMQRKRIAVHGMPGKELSCNELKQHQGCVVNQDKTVSFSRVKLRVQEGAEGATITVRLNHELTSNDTVNKSTLTHDELNALKGYDVIIYLDIPDFFRKEIVIDPMRIGWNKDRWDIVHQVKITALDDFNIDALEQTIIVTPKIHSVDREYNKLALHSLEIIVEDNEKCRYCGVANVKPFNPVPNPPFWDFKSILILVLFLITILFILWRIYTWFKQKYGVRNEYDTLQQDGLLDESTEDTANTTSD